MVNPDNPLLSIARLHAAKGDHVMCVGLSWGQSERMAHELSVCVSATPIPAGPLSRQIEKNPHYFQIPTLIIIENESELATGSPNEWLIIQKAARHAYVSVMVKTINGQDVQLPIQKGFAS